MKRIPLKRPVIAVAAGLSLLGAGCSGPANNTQRGAAGGAALGALAGAVIGNNRGSGNAASGAVIGAAAGAIAGGALGHRQDVNERQSANGGYDPEADATTSIVIQGAAPIAPAPLAESITPRPTSDATWIPGYWSYDSGNAYAWIPGHWEIAPAGFRTFIPPHWNQQGGAAVYVRGYWR